MNTAYQSREIPGLLRIKAGRFRFAGSPERVKCRRRAGSVARPPPVPFPCSGLFRGLPRRISSPSAVGPREGGAAFRQPGVQAAFPARRRAATSTTGRSRRARIRHVDACFEDLNPSRPRGRDRNFVRGQRRSRPGPQRRPYPDRRPLRSRSMGPTSLRRYNASVCWFGSAVAGLCRAPVLSLAGSQPLRGSARYRSRSSLGAMKDAIRYRRYHPVPRCDRATAA